MASLYLLIAMRLLLLDEGLGDSGLATVLVGLLGMAAGFAVYFLPSFIANGKYQQRSIFWLNLLAGWTVLGWLGALIWAISTPQTAPQPVVIQPRPASQADELTKLAQLHQAGQLTDEEFTQAKARLL